MKKILFCTLCISFLKVFAYATYHIDIVNDTLLSAKTHTDLYDCWEEGYPFTEDHDLYSYSSTDYLYTEDKCAFANQSLTMFSVQFYDPKDSSRYIQPYHVWIARQTSSQPYWGVENVTSHSFDTIDMSNKNFTTKIRLSDVCGAGQSRSKTDCEPQLNLIHH